MKKIIQIFGATIIILVLFYFFTPVWGYQRIPSTNGTVIIGDKVLVGDDTFVGFQINEEKIIAGWGDFQWNRISDGAELFDVPTNGECIIYKKTGKYIYNYELVQARAQFEVCNPWFKYGFWVQVR